MLFGALFVSVLAAAPTPAHAVSPGSGGWYWPVGTENFKGWDGWWECRPQAIKHSTITSAWSFRWAPTELGQYKLVVSHEDLGHAYSQKTAYTRVRR